jgi:hypothetical protein
MRHPGENSNAKESSGVPTAAVGPGVLLESFFQTWLVLFSPEGWPGWSLIARVQRGPSEAARCASTGDQQAILPFPLPAASASTRDDPALARTFLTPAIVLHNLFSDSFQTLFSMAGRSHLQPGEKTLEALSGRGWVTVLAEPEWPVPAGGEDGAKLRSRYKQNAASSAVKRRRGLVRSTTVRGCELRESSDWRPLYTGHSSSFHAISQNIHS